MNKTLLIALIALTVSASAQTTFEQIEKTTRDNHTQLVPPNFKQYFADTSQVTYTDGKDFLYFNFTKGRFTSFSTTNVKYGVPGVEKYKFSTQYARGNELQVYDKAGVLIHIITVLARERYVFYNVGWAKNELASRPNKYLPTNKAWFN